MGLGDNIPRTRTPASSHLDRRPLSNVSSDDAQAGNSSKSAELEEKDKNTVDERVAASAHLNRLPEDILYKVFQLLEPLDILAMRQACISLPNCARRSCSLISPLM